jgi:hypothetical protein
VPVGTGEGLCGRVDQYVGRVRMGIWTVGWSQERVQGEGGINGVEIVGEDEAGPSRTPRVTVVHSDKAESGNDGMTWKGRAERWNSVRERAC